MRDSHHVQQYIWKAVQDYGAMSKADMKKKLKFSRQAVNHAVAEMLERNMLYRFWSKAEGKTMYGWVKPCMHKEAADGM